MRTEVGMQQDEVETNRVKISTSSKWGTVGERTSVIPKPIHGSRSHLFHIPGFHLQK